MIITKIVEATKIRVAKAKEDISLENIKALAPRASQPFSFERALEARPMAFICELKKASPSKGVIAEHFPYLAIAQAYEAAGANAISVLTEPDFFMGSDSYLTAVKKQVQIPVLRKDFIIDEYQIYQASLIGADAILLISAILSAVDLKKYLGVAESLGLSCLVEAHDATEVQMALAAGARIIGVNNRDLRSFEVDLNNCIELKKLVPENLLFVAESGISTSDDIRRLKHSGINAVLIGETLMRSKDRHAALAKLKEASND